MIIPHVHTPTTPASYDDHRELATALKLLAGFECLRDAQQAHTMLVRLTESDRRDVAEDARTVLTQGLRKDWFGETKPFYQDLVALATRSDAGRRASRLSRLSIPVGLMALIGGLLFFYRERGGELEPSILAVIIGLFIVAIAAKFVLRR